MTTHIYIDITLLPYDVQWASLNAILKFRSSVKDMECCNVLGYKHCVLLKGQDGGGGRAMLIRPKTPEDTSVSWRG